MYFKKNKDVEEVSSLGMIQNQINRKTTRLNRLKSDRSLEINKRSKEINKISRARDRLRRTKSSSVIRSKTREIERAERNKAAIDKKIANLEVQIARLEKQISDDEEDYSKRKLREQKKVKREELKREKETDRKLKQIGRDVADQDRIQSIHEQQIAELKALPKEITVLFMAFNPAEQSPLRLDQEARDIEEKIKLSKHRDSVKFKTKWAVRAADILQAINDYNPEIIHFSGHGNEDGLALEKTDGSTHFVHVDAITQAIQTTSDNIKLIFFNTCHSHTQAEAVTEYIDVAIGMNDTISDEAAKVFSAQFYSSIGFGYSVEKSFQQGIAALMLENTDEDHIPQLFMKKQVHAQEVVIVQP